MVFVNSEDLVEELEIFGLEAKDDVLNELKKVCDVYSCNAEDIVTKWVAFSHSSGNIPLTMGRLSDFQLYLTSSKTKSKPSKSHSTSLGATHLARSILADSQPDAGVLDLYSENPSDSPIAVSKPTPKTPVTKTYKNKANTTPKVQPVVFDSPKLSQNIMGGDTPSSQKYDSRQDSGAVIKELGLLSKRDENMSELEGVKLCDKVIFDTTPIKYPKTLSTDPASQQSALYNALINMGDAMQDLYGFDITQLTFTTTEEVVGLGRIVCDGDGKMNSKSILLQTPMGDQLTLELDACDNYALFPGQNVAVKGTNPGGGRVFVTQVFPGANALPTVIEVPEGVSGILTVFSASGPFIPNDTVSLQPFQDLIQNVRTIRPNFLIINGPFLDSRNEKLLQCEEPLSELFDGMILTLSNLTNDLGMTTIVLPSPREFNHISNYPIRPFSISKFDVSKSVHFLPDPCMFSINGIVFGVSATDSVFHISFQECSKQVNSRGAAGNMDRISRLVSHLLRQQSFYPLYPSHNDVPMDLDLLPLLQMSIQPHVLILPSELSPYVKIVEGCVALNPGSVIKGQSAGSFGLLQIDLDKLSDQTSVVEESFCCKVVKL